MDRIGNSLGGKMRTMKLSCDSTCDLTPELYARFNVGVVPLGVVLGDTLFHDGVDIHNEQIYSYVKENGTLPKTSAVSVEEYEEFFQRYTEAGQTVIHISLSSELSASYHHACMAAESLGNVYVVDSKNLSSGSGLLVMRAAERIKEGLPAQAIVAELNSIKEDLDVSFVLETLEYLHKGGRCSGLAALGANLLKIHPEIVVQNGKMQLGKKYRGKTERILSDYVKGRLEGREDLDLERIFITHSGVADELVEVVEAAIRKLQDFREIHVSIAGSTISSHCGPGCLGLLFLKK